jgi:hypothetical protein
VRKIVETILYEDLLKNTQGYQEVERVVIDYCDNLFSKELPDKGPLMKAVFDLLETVINSTQYKSVEELREAFDSFQITSKNDTVRRQYVEVLTQGGHEILIVTLPDVKNAPKDIKANAATYINFISVMLGIESNNVRVVLDESLGKVIGLPKVVNDTMKNLISAARSSTGLIGMKEHKFKSGFKGPMPALITAIRLLKRQLAYYRKNSKDATNLQILRDSVETEFGFKQPGINQFVVNLIKQTLTIMTSETQKHFPASFYAVAKSENKVQSSEGILAVLGYIKLLPKLNKLAFIASQTFETDDKGKPTKVDYENKEPLPRDGTFYAMCKLTLPLLHKDDNVALKDQLKNPELHLTEQARKYFKEKTPCIDALNKAYAFSAAFKAKKTKKTKLVHVMNEHGKAVKMINSSLKFVDGEGHSVDSYMDLRYSYRNRLELLFKRVKSPKKRKDRESVEPSPKAKEVASSEKPPPKRSRTKTPRPVVNRFEELQDDDISVNSTTGRKTADSSAMDTK